MQNPSSTYRNNDFTRLDSLVYERYYDTKSYQYYSEKVSTGQAKKLTYSAGLMQLLCDHNTKNQVKKLGFEGVMSGTELRQFVLAYVEKKAEEESVYYPTLTVKKRSITLSGLVNKLTRFKKWGLKALLSARMGNKNAQKVTEKAGRLLNGLDTFEDTKLLQPQIYGEYTLVALGAKEFTDKDTGELFSKEDDLPFLSLTTVKRFLNNSINKIGNSRRRHGKKHTDTKYKPRVKGVAPAHSGSMLAGDGQTMPFFLKDKNGKKTYDRYSVYYVFDVGTKAILSAQIMRDENTDGMRQAYYKALKTMNFKKPGEIVLDNFGRKTLEEDLGLITEHLNYIPTGESWKNPAERMIGMFDNEHLRRTKGWIGSGIQSKKASSRPNPDIKPTHYTIEELEWIYSNAISQWNKKRIKKFYKKLNPELVDLNRRTIVELFGQNTNITINAEALNMEVATQKYSFEVPNCEQILVKNAINGERVRVKFLPDSLEMGVYAYRFDRYDIKNTAHDVFLTHCPPSRGVQRSSFEQTEEGLKDLGHEEKRKDTFEQFMASHEENTPKLTEVVQQLTKKEAEAVLMSQYNLDKGLLKRAKEALSGGSGDDLLHGSDWDGVGRV